MSTYKQSEIAILKACALKQFNGEKFFILLDSEDQEIESAYEGNEEEARAAFEAEIEGTGDPATDGNFSIYCSNNLTSIDPIDGDEEREGYLVLTDEEADEKAKESIEQSLWAFTPFFLSDQTELPEEVFQSISNNGRCESNNEVIEKIINKTTDIDTFVSDAISADGRGHFMSSYDGNENEETVEGETFYIYRIN